MYLRDLLAKYPVWLPGSRQPVFITNAALLRRAIGFSRQYCSEAWNKRVPMTKAMATRLHAVSRKTIPLEKLFAVQPRAWAPEKLRQIAASRARQKQKFQDLLAKEQAQQPETGNLP